MSEDTIDETGFTNCNFCNRKIKSGNCCKECQENYLKNEELWIADGCPSLITHVEVDNDL